LTGGSLLRRLSINKIYHMPEEKATLPVVTAGALLFAVK
jgi:hypothetical protein